MCGRIVSYIDIPTLKRIARVTGSRKALKSSRGFNLGPSTHQASIVHASLKACISPTQYPKEILLKSAIKVQLNQPKTPIESTAVSPSQTHPIAKSASLLPPKSEARFMTSMKWGLNIPNSSNNKESNFCINLRVETLHDKFPKLLPNRCIIIAEGYYEWKDNQPYYISPKNSELLYLACLFRVTEENEMEFAIITNEAEHDFQRLHHRSPCYIKDPDLDSWISPNTNFHSAKTLLRHPSEVDFTIKQVSKLVNSIKNNSSDCILPLSAYTAKLKSTGIEKFFTSIPQKRKPSPPNSSNLKRPLKNPNQSNS